AGPVGLVCALAASRSGRVALLARPSPSSSRGVEAVPAALLALLVELGVHPAELGIDALYTRRFASWERATQDEHASPPAAHVDRDLLEGALRRRVRETRAIDVLVAERRAPIWERRAWRGD